MRDFLKQAKYWHLRINWRVTFSLAVWIMAPLVLDPETTKTVRSAAELLIVAAFLSWANREGYRSNETRNPGFLGHRRGDLKK